MPETYRFEQLDAETRAYLRGVRVADGQGAPGVFAATPNSLPFVGLACGTVLVVATLFLTFPPTEHPVKEALLQTAGILLGGWLIAAAFRVWFAQKIGSNPGHFVYADPEAMYVASGSAVAVTPLHDLREAKALQNFNEGNYQNTTITLKLGRGERTFVEVKNEERGRRMTVFLNAVAYMRSGGEDGNNTAYKSLTPEQMAATAKEVARTGEFPRGVPEDGAGTRIPRPRADGRASLGLIGIAAWALIGVGLFFGFKTINQPARDMVVFERIQELPANERPPALRLYLANPAFQANRDKAQQMLDQAYDEGVRVHVQGTDADLKAALGELILSLKTREPVVSLITAEERVAGKDDLNATARETALRNTLADKLGSTIGDGLVVFAAPTKEQSNTVDTALKGMIDVRWKFLNPALVEYTIEFRKTPDDEPYQSKTFQMKVEGSPTDFAKAVGVNILTASVGGIRERPAVPQGDF